MDRVKTVLENIKNRRTIKPKEFLNKEIPRNVIEDILESANWAPNHGRTEPWRLTVFSGKGITENYINIVKTVFEETPDHLKKPEKLAKWTGNAPHASYIIAFGLMM